MAAVPFSTTLVSEHEVDATLLAQLPCSVVDRLCGLTFERATAYAEAFAAEPHVSVTSRPDTVADGRCPAPMLPPSDDPFPLADAVKNANAVPAVTTKATVTINAINAAGRRFRRCIRVGVLRLMAAAP